MYYAVQGFHRASRKQTYAYIITMQYPTYNEHVYDPKYNIIW